MRGRVRGYLHLSRQAAVTEQRRDGAAVALVGVHTDHLDGIRPPPRLLLHPSAHLSGVAPFEYVDDLAGGGVDRGGDEPPPAEAAGGGHDRLVEPQLCDRAQPGGIAGELLGGFPHRRPQRLPAHAEPPGRRRHRPLNRLQPAHSPPHSPRGQHPARPRQRRLLGPTPRLAPRTRARPNPLFPPDPDRAPARRRGVAQTHLPAPLGPGPAPATIAEHPLAIGSLHPHHHLPPLLANAGHLETVRAEPHRSTNLNHQGPPASWTIDSHKNRRGPHPTGGPSNHPGPSFIEKTQQTESNGLPQHSKRLLRSMRQTDQTVAGNSTAQLEVTRTNSAIWGE